MSVPHFVRSRQRNHFTLSQGSLEYCSLDNLKSGADSIPINVWEWNQLLDARVAHNLPSRATALSSAGAGISSCRQQHKTQSFVFVEPHRVWGRVRNFAGWLGRWATESLKLYSTVLEPWTERLHVTCVDACHIFLIKTGCSLKVQHVLLTE